MFIDIEAAGCPNTCRHCTALGHPPHGRHYTLEELRRISREWGPLTEFHEPTAHPDFPKTYDPSISTDHGGSLVTCGYGIARREDYADVLEQLHEIGIERMHFTLHGLQEHHDWFVCRKGAFNDIATATRRAKKAGFQVSWKIYLDKKGLDGIESLVDIARKECGKPPTMSIPFSGVSKRLWRLERIRPTLTDIQRLQLHMLVNDSKRQLMPDPVSLTAASWLEKWKQSPDSDEFVGPFEPESWPPKPPFEWQAIRILRDRKVYLFPRCAPLIYLGELSEGKTVILERLGRLQAPEYAGISRDDVVFTQEELEELHPTGFSVRYKAISKLLFAQS
jgi:hypothetical protein